MLRYEFLMNRLEDRDDSYDHDAMSQSERSFFLAS